MAKLLTFLVVFTSLSFAQIWKTEWADTMRFKGYVEFQSGSGLESRFETDSTDKQDQLDSLLSYQSGIYALSNFTGANDSIKLATALSVLGSEAALRFDPDNDTLGIQTIDVDVILPRGVIFTNSQKLTFTGGIDASLSEHFDSTVILTGAVIEEAYAEWFGAKGDGSTDDLIPLRNLSLSGAKTIILSRDYAISDSLDLTISNQILSGNGILRLKNSSNSHLITIAADSVKIKDITIWGNGSNQTGNLAGILVKASNFVADNIIMHEARTWGIRFKIAPYGEVRDSKFYDVGISPAGSDAIQFDLGSDHGKAINNDIYNPYSNGVSGNGCDFLKINGNRIYDAVTATNGGGISINQGGGASHGCRWSEIIGNTVKTFYLIGISVGESEHTTVSGNTVYSDSSTAVDGIEIASSNYCSVTGNVVYSPNYTLDVGIILAGSPSPVCRYNTVTANTIKGMSLIGIDLEGSVNTTISANVIDSVSDVSLGTGIYFNGGSYGIVQANMITRVTRAIFVGSASYITVNSNIIKPTTGETGIRFNDVDNYVAIGNIVDSAYVGSQIELGVGDTLGIIEDNFTTSFSTNYKTLTSTAVFYPGYGHDFILQTNGANKEFNPATTVFPLYFKVTIANIDATYSIIFDASGLNQTIATGQRAIFMFTGTAGGWIKIYLGS